MDRLPFVDWMKAIGMLLIVYGHSAAGTHYFTTDPIYVKQLGVAFFVFVTGYTLARDTRPTGYVVFSRLFGICLYGFGFAVFMSIVGLWLRGDPAESNYLPFFLGANVFFNSFPANPTTWFIGTYFHIIVLWALFLRRSTVQWWMLWAWIPVSIAVRAALIVSLGQYVAYMFITNWIAVFLLGILCANTSREKATTGRPWWIDVVTTVGLGLCLLLVWPACVNAMHFGKEFPFELIQVTSPVASLIGTSVLVEVIYILGTLFVFRLGTMLPRLGIVEFFARNTLVIFIFHMPLMYMLGSYVGVLDNRHLRIVANVAIYYVMLAFLGELLGAAIRKSRLQSACLARLQAIGVIAR